jgi:hypothetical protein
VTLLAGAWLAPFRLSALLGAGGALLALGAARGGAVGRRWPHAGAAVACLILAAAAPVLDGSTERARFAGTAPGLRLRGATDTPYQLLALGGDEVLHLFSSGQYAGSFPTCNESPRPPPRRCAPHRGASSRGGGARPRPVLLRHPVRRWCRRARRAAYDFLLGGPEADRAALRDPRAPCTTTRGTSCPRAPRRAVRLAFLGGEPARSSARGSPPSSSCARGAPPA